MSPYSLITNLKIIIFISEIFVTEETKRHARLRSISPITA
jgi:hypothetical protein